MKKPLIAVILAVVTVFYVGYYKALKDGDIETIVFIKKYPTVQMSSTTSTPMMDQKGRAPDDRGAGADH